MQNIRDSISGVSMDEEAAKLIEYQKSFEASARLIKTADEMFDTVLNLKRM
jgi:flagellar hook-associated protein 1